MAALVCDLCGGKLTMGAGGIATCESCGMEHTAERMKEKVQEIKGKVSVEGTVQVDSSHLIQNYLSMANSAYDSNNKAEAEMYCNKVIEINPNDYDAWLLKGKAAGWQSTLSNIRFSESVQCFSSAIKYAPKEKKDSIVELCKSEISKLSKALISLRGERFEKWPDAEEKNGFISDLTAVINTIIEFFNKTGSLINKDELTAPLASIVTSSSIKAWNNIVLPQYENDNDGHPDEFEFKRFIERAGYCSELINTAIELCDTDDIADKQRYSSLITIYETINKSCSYDYQTVFIGYSRIDGSKMYDNQYVKTKELTDESKAANRKLISNCQEKIRIIEQKEKREKARLEAEKRKKEQEDDIKRHGKYWAKHQKEFKELTERKKRLEKQLSDLEKSSESTRKISAIKKEIDMIPGESEIANIHERIKKLESEKSSLGFFKGKEKKAIQVQIEQAESEKRKIQNRMDTEKNRLNSRIESIKNERKRKIDSLQKQIDQINYELNRERSNIELVGKDLFSLLKKKYKLRDHGENTVNDFFQTEANKQSGTWKIVVENNQGISCGVEIYANNTSSEIKKIQVGTNDNEDNLRLASEVSKVILDAMNENSVPLETISNMFSDGKQKESVIGDYSVSYEETRATLAILNMTIVSRHITIQ